MFWPLSNSLHEVRGQNKLSPCLNLQNFEQTNLFHRMYGLALNLIISLSGHLSNIDEIENKFNIQFGHSIFSHKSLILIFIFLKGSVISIEKVAHGNQFKIDFLVIEFLVISWSRIGSRVKISHYIQPSNLSSALDLGHLGESSTSEGPKTSPPRWPTNENIIINILRSANLIRNFITFNSSKKTQKGGWWF